MTELLCTIIYKIIQILEESINCRREQYMLILLFSAVIQLSQISYSYETNTHGFFNTLKKAAYK